MTKRLDETAAGAVLTASTADEEERLRALIRVELDRQNALPLARRTLELLAEAAAEPAEGAPGYRIVDRAGETRLRPLPAEKEGKGKDGKGKEGKGKDGAADIAEPMTLRDLVDELRARHPDLFGAPPEPETPPEPAPHGTVHDRMAHVREAGARFVETQSALARSLAHSSAERGRALASAASETFGGWRAQFDERLKAHRAPASVSAEPAALPEAASAQAGRNRFAFVRTAGMRLRAAGARFGASARGFGGSARGFGESARGALGRGTAADRQHEASAATADSRTGRRRAALVGLGSLAGIAVLAAAILMARRDAGTATPETPTQPAPSTETATAPPPAAAQKPAPAPVSPPPQAAPAPAAPQPADAELQPETEEPPRNANTLAGVPEVIDTATLRVSGRVVRLFGVEWVRGAQAVELTKYLSGRSVTCQPAPGSSAFLCMVDGRDLSEVVLYNGGGRASSEASPDLVAAEDHARSERLGVWRR